jgi:2-polyprenyl-6-hydroxyphenyl methylase/3-demethylubiquinone-9 3-methyltransferase
MTRHHQEAVPVRQAKRGGRPANDPAQYDDLTREWWDPHGVFAALHWLAEARGRLVPPPTRDGARLLDVACGAGLLGPYLEKGWRHVGLDLSQLSLRQARDHGLTPVRADALNLPFADGSFDCVVAGEALEHLPDLEQACEELARVLVPGGTLVVDTLADTWFTRIALMAIAERFPGGPPPGIHRKDLLVDPGRLKDALAAHRVHVTAMNGLRPAVLDYFRWLRHRTSHVRMLEVRSTAGVYQATAVKENA